MNRNSYNSFNVNVCRIHQTGTTRVYKIIGIVSRYMLVYSTDTMPVARNLPQQ